MISSHHGPCRHERERPHVLSTHLCWVSRSPYSGAAQKLPHTLALLLTLVASLTRLPAAGQLVEALGGLPDGQDVLVSLFSIFSAAGRLACGSFPEALWHRYGVPRWALPRQLQGQAIAHA